jgi:methylmalonyl-CoA mutase
MESVNRVRKLVEGFESREGRRPRILIAKMGQDGHDRGQKVIATAFADLGFDVDIGPAVPDARRSRAPGRRERRAHHRRQLARRRPPHACPRAARRTEEARAPDIMIVVGGVIPPQDYDALRQAGAKAIFPPGTIISDAAVDLLNKLNEELGYSSNAA